MTGKAGRFDQNWTNQILPTMAKMLQTFKSIT